MEGEQLAREAHNGVLADAAALDDGVERGARAGAPQHLMRRRRRLAAQHRVRADVFVQRGAHHGAHGPLQVRRGVVAGVAPAQQAGRHRRQVVGVRLREAEHGKDRHRVGRQAVGVDVHVDLAVGAQRAQKVVAARGALLAELHEARHLRVGAHKVVAHAHVHQQGGQNGLLHVAALHAHLLHLAVGLGHRGEHVDRKGGPVLLAVRGVVGQQLLHYRAALRFAAVRRGARAVQVALVPAAVGAHDAQPRRGAQQLAAAGGRPLWGLRLEGALRDAAAVGAHELHAAHLQGAETLGAQLPAAVLRRPAAALERAREGPGRGRERGEQAVGVGGLHSVLTPPQARACVAGNHLRKDSA